MKNRKHLESSYRKRKISRVDKDNTLGNIKTVSSINDFSDVDIVIEATVEDLAIKKAVFNQLDGICRPDCILASNTSSFSLSSIASSCLKSERVIGIHFFNPAPIMPLVEIIPALQTSERVVNVSRDLIDSWGKVTVIAKDTPGFIVNRIARPFYGEALRIYEEGMASFATIDWALTHKGGFRMGPFTLMDLSVMMLITLLQSLFLKLFILIQGTNHHLLKKVMPKLVGWVKSQERGIMIILMIMLSSKLIRMLIKQILYSKEFC